MPDRNQRLSTPAIVAVLLLASLFAVWAASQRPDRLLNDDSYITLTYAKNLAAGRGFVFNYPPAVLGTTTPLFALLVAGLAWLLPNIAIGPLAVFLTAACWIGCIWLVFLFRHSLRLAAWQAGLLGLVMAASGLVSYLGMEAYLFAFFLLLSLALAAARRWFLAGAATGCLFLARGDGALMLAVLAGYALAAGYVVLRSPASTGSAAPANRPVCGQWRMAWRPLCLLALGFLLLTGPWLIYGTLTFGSPLPNPLAAKMAQGQTGLWHSMAVALRDWFPLWGRGFGAATQPWLNLWWLLALAGIVSSARRRPVWLAACAWLLLYLAGYLLLGVPGYWWYQVPILFVTNLFVGLGLIEACTWPGRLPTLRRPAQAAAVCLLAFVLFTLAQPKVQQVLKPPDDYRAASYMEVCRWLNSHTQAGDSVAMLEIGYLGYFTDNRIIDLLGLVLPDVAPHVADADFAWVFWQYRPDYYLYLPDFDAILGAIRSDPRFSHEYQAVATLPGPRQTDFIVYQRLTPKRLFLPLLGGDALKRSWSFEQR